jgi:hypothetical protein
MYILYNMILFCIPHIFQRNWRWRQPVESTTHEPLVEPLLLFGASGGLSLS